MQYRKGDQLEKINTPKEFDMFVHRMVARGDVPLYNEEVANLEFFYFNKKRKHLIR